jgi:hypothetical protein
MIIKITWNNEGGQMDFRILKGAHIPGEEIADTLAEMVEGQSVQPGDSFTVEEIK